MRLKRVDLPTFGRPTMATSDRDMVYRRSARCSSRLVSVRRQYQSTEMACDFQGGTSGGTRHAPVNGVFPITCETPNGRKGLAEPLESVSFGDISSHAMSLREQDVFLPVRRAHHHNRYLAERGVTLPDPEQ